MLRRPSVIISGPNLEKAPSIAAAPLAAPRCRAVRRRRCFGSEIAHVLCSPFFGPPFWTTYTPAPKTQHKRSHISYAAPFYVAFLP